ncbi:MAG: ATP synthase F0 subunit C [Treponema sp.]|jgi:F-type H+-transporting ATPase subunit c|nr:ATP synthase F0 subunit C [Treponema sp.]MDR1220054.1 ATP synthase F0 subunit C [Treponema sp.]
MTGTLIAIGAGIAVVTGIGAGIGIGIATSGLIQAIARQPEASNKMIPWFFVGAALAESTAIYGLVVAILLYLKV